MLRLILLKIVMGLLMPLGVHIWSSVGLLWSTLSMTGAGKTMLLVAAIPLYFRERGDLHCDTLLRDVFWALCNDPVIIRNM